MSKLTPKEGRLYVVSTPIGNFNDITIRALNVLREADLVLCENFKEASALLKYFSLDKELDSITVKSEEERYPEFIMMIEEGKTIALISDCGTPAFADPGNQLINTAVARDLDVQVLPGATSIMTALVRCGFDIERFYFAGFLSRTSPERVAELRKLSMNDDTFCLLETPYRLLPMLEDAVQVIPNRRAYLACNLTMKNETHHYGTIQELYDKFKDKKVKMEFVFVIEGNTSGLPLEKIKYVERSSDSGYEYQDRREERPEERKYGRQNRNDIKRADRPRFPRASSPRRNEGRGDDSRKDGGRNERPRFDRESRPTRDDRRDSRPKRDDGIDRPSRESRGGDRPRFSRDDRGGDRPPRRDSRDGERPRYDKESRPRRDDIKKLPRRKDELGRSQVQRRSRDTGDNNEKEVRNFAGWRKEDIKDKKPNIDKDKNDNNES